jgi:hypothetical protein
VQLIEKILLKVPSPMKRGKVSFYDAEARAGVIESKIGPFYFERDVYSEGEPSEGQSVAFQTWSAGMAHNIVIDPN